MQPVDRVTHVPSGLPIGPAIETSAAPRPGRSILRGQLATMVPLDPAAHAESSTKGTNGADRERVWLTWAPGRSQIAQRFELI